MKKNLIKKEEFIINKKDFIIETEYNYLFLGSFIIRCKDKEQLQNYYSILQKRIDELDVNMTNEQSSYFTHMIIDTIEARNISDNFFIKLNLFVEKEDRYCVDDILHFKSSIERITKEKPFFSTSNKKLNKYFFKDTLQIQDLIKYLSK